MQLTLHAEYALRVLLYAGCHPDRSVSTREISEAHCISKHHLVRVVQTLGRCKYLRVIPGRSGGMELAKDPRQIRLGDVVRAAEPNMYLAECFNHHSNVCPLTPVCSLAPVLKEALDAFLSSLNNYTLADLLANGVQREMAAILIRLTS